MEGIAEAGLTVEESASLFGFGSVDAFRSWVITGVLADWDKNGNGYVCIADLPNTPGLPGYIFNATDDNSSSQLHA